MSSLNAFNIFKNIIWSSKPCTQLHSPHTPTFKIKTVLLPLGLIFRKDELKFSESEHESWRKERGKIIANFLVQFLSMELETAGLTWYLMKNMAKSEAMNMYTSAVDTATENERVGMKAKLSLFCIL